MSTLNVQNPSPAASPAASPLSPVLIELGTTDPVQLAAILFEKNKEQLEMQRKGFQEDPAKSPEENAQLRLAWEEKLRVLCHTQMQIVFFIRKTGTGPAKAGGKRAKKAPLDQRAIDDAIFG